MSVSWHYRISPPWAKLVILTDEGVTPELEVIGLTMRAAPDGPGVKPPAVDVLLAFEPLTAAGRALELGWRHPESA